MTAVWKKALGLGIAALLAAGMLCMPLAASNAYADAPANSASKSANADSALSLKAAKSFKGLKLNWTLKNGKMYKMKTQLAVLGTVNYGTIGISNFKKTKLSDGNVKITFSFNMKRSWVPSSRQIHKYMNTDSEYRFNDGGYYFSIADYKTGKSLEGLNNPTAKKLGVEVESTGFTHSDYKKYTDPDGCWWRFPRKTTNMVTITMPASYKGLCIGVGGYNSLKPSSKDDSYFSGGSTFASTTYYKKGKTNSFWMRVK